MYPGWDLSITNDKQTKNYDMGFFKCVDLYKKNWG